ncbi:unnamed protein product [Spirodela intermedia]|uniref:Protein EARLY FLOWERING 4 domain-containing protein n=1 Tax=Spirodela intermedia TaxID=51605 RepID=A0A7I8J362_SPIIN|nr:unnamed protein product [Spirodela intermedia]CAA6664676.1 unnamed protein product [Spirodela intermedia]
MEGDAAVTGLGNGGAAAQVDGKVLQTFQKSFVQVQNILDQNRLLINEINQNHESKIPDNLTRNVGLIRELNNNIRRVVDLYADLSTSLSKSVETSSEDNSAARPAGKRVRPPERVAGISILSLRSANLTLPHRARLLTPWFYRLRKIFFFFFFCPNNSR